MWNVKASDTSNMNRGNWNHLTVTQTIPQQQTGKADQGNYRKQPYWALRTYAGKCSCKSTKRISLGNNITCSTNCKHRTAATLYTLDAWLYLGI
jgi:hypothetical protein